MPTAENPPSMPAANPRIDRGKLAVVSILALALVMATVAWWWNYERGRRCLDLFGSQAAVLIRRAPRVEILGVAGEATDVSQAQGLLNARTALLDDASYEWNVAARPADDGRIVRFSQGNAHVSLRFARQEDSLTVVETGRTATLKQKTADGWREFLGRHVP
ncbi:MAG: hypothetical protein SFU86_14990 [Pirellulaceae bacterium]|nr:hypothetical protein [Pirellulaceae bacterium]